MNEIDADELEPLPSAFGGGKAAVAVRREGDPLAIGRPRRPEIATPSCGQRPRLAGGEVQDPKIRKTLSPRRDKGNLAAIGRECGLIVVGRIGGQPFDVAAVGMHTEEIGGSAPLRRKRRSNTPVGDHAGVDATADNSTLNGRTDLWRSVIDDLSPSNIVGYGINGDRYYVRTISLWAEHSHNSVLETILSAGYLGALLIVAALTIAFTRLIRQWQSRPSRVIAAALLYVIVAGMMNPSWFDTSSLIVICAACSAHNARASRLQQAGMRIAA